MPTFRTAIITGILSQRPGLQRLDVLMADGAQARAYALTGLTGENSVGDTIICNTTAVELGLGTGGWHVVHWNNSRAELVAPGPDHVMKLRYTSLQVDAGTSELEHPLAADAPLDGTPVVVCTLHSQMAMVALAFAAAAPGMRLVYVMTDGAALPLALSDVVAGLRERNLLSATVSAGHSFGGDLEAVTPAAALGLARHVQDADAIVVAMGPGVVGTGTSMGTTAVEAGALLDLVRYRGGLPVLCVRASDGDDRGRHRGISHHVEAVLGLTASKPYVASEPPEVRNLVGVNVIRVDPPDPIQLLADSGLAITTMGRGPVQDPLFFRSAVAAGTLAAELVMHGADPHGT